MQFVTERLPLAVYLHASQSLKLIECKSTRPHRVGFVFDDPENIATSCELEFESGKAISASAIFASLKYLKRLMIQQLDEQAILKWGF